MTTESRKNYAAAWMLARRERLLSEYKARLGGVCAEPGCGVTEDLRFCHKNWRERDFYVTQCINRAKEVVDAEVAKCRLLCRDHARLQRRQDRREKAREASGVDA